MKECLAYSLNSVLPTIYESIRNECIYDYKHQKYEVIWKDSVEAEVRSHEKMLFMMMMDGALVSRY